MTESEKLQEVIATSWTEFSEVEVVSLSHSSFPEEILVTSQLEQGFEIVIDGVTRQVNYIPMSLGLENNDELIANTRTLTLQGMNDIISYYEDMLDPDDTERVEANIYSYLLDRSGNISSVQAHFKYWNMNSSYSEKNNACTLTLATSPTNDSETGIKFTSVKFPSLAGAE